MKILFVGRLVDFKGPIIFIKAAQFLSQNTPENPHEFIVAGDGELMNECKKLASGYSNISLLGWVDQQTVNDLMDQADVFCQLSPYENIWAASLISAMKHKKAVICTDVGYTRTYLTHNYNVFLIPPNDHVALAEAIKKLANDSQLRHILGENARSFVRENLSVEKITGEIQQLLVQVVEQFREKRISE